MAKTLAGRHRPDASAVPLVRRLTRQPHSTSFPSGHAASAAAFATGVLLESPRAALVVLPLAAAVAFSRVYVGVHYPSDVAAGAALGIGAALATCHWWPTHTAETGAPRTRAAAPVLTAGGGLIVVVNQHSGASVPGLGASADRIRDLLPLAEIVEPGPHDDLTATLDQAATQAAGQGAALGVCGGDGTVNAAASSARRAGVALAVFPGGTHNHFAKDLGNRTFDDTARAFENGQATPIDLAHAGHEVTFLNTFSLGAYPELVRVRERWEKKIGKPAASVLALLRVLPNAQPLTVTVNGTPQRLWLLFAGNGTYVPEGITPHHRPHLDDNLIDLRLVTADKPLARTRLLLSTLLAAPRRSRVYGGLRAAQFDLSGVEDGTGMAYDGEQTKAPTRLRLSKTASAVLAYAPAERE